MYRTRISLALAAAVAALVTASAVAAAPGPDHGAGAVYTLTNAVAGNAVVIFSRAADGSLVQQGGTVPTGGTGTAGGLGSQGALVLDRDRLYAVNAGSNSISELKIAGNGVQLVTTVASGGVMPISLTVHDHTLYVLNAGGTPNITGFDTGGNSLTPIPGSTRKLGPLSSGPAEVAFSPDGRTLVVTEKGSSTIDIFAIGKRGVPSLAAASVSSGVTPFGFAFDKRGNLFVSEAGSGSASSYELDGGLYPISSAVPTGQGAPCWLVVTDDGRYAYTANGGSGTITGFSIDHDGNLALLDPSGVSANLGAGSHPLEEAISQDGKYLYNLTDLKHGISALRINADGSLGSVGFYGVLPAGAAGIAAQ